MVGGSERRGEASIPCVQLVIEADRVLVRCGLTTLACLASLKGLGSSVGNSTWVLSVIV